MDFIGSAATATTSARDHLVTPVLPAAGRTRTLTPTARRISVESTHAQCQTGAVLLTITTTHDPADELGYLLGKHPDRMHRVELSFGVATLCFPEVTSRRCTAALVVDVDPVRLVRGGPGGWAPGGRSGRGDGASLGQYVNDRPYSASSLLSVAIGRALGSALHGRCRDRPELAATPIPLELAVPAVRDADALAESLFAPLGWEVRSTPLAGGGIADGGIADSDPADSDPAGGHVGLRLTGTHAAARRPHLHRHPAGRFRHGRSDGGGGARRPRTAARAGPGGFRGGRADPGPGDHPEPGLQRPLPGIGARGGAAPRPPLRVDPCRVRDLVLLGGGPARIPGPPGRDRRPGPRARAADPARGVQPGNPLMELPIPELSLVLMVGASGAGKSTFAGRHFLPTEALSSDVFRGLVADDPTDQGATADAFDALHHLVAIRLRRGRLTVVDATNTQRAARASLIELAREHDVLPVAIVLDLPEPVCLARSRFGPAVVRRQRDEPRRSVRKLKAEGFRAVHVLSTPDEVDTATIVRTRSYNDRRELTGPFDLIGDVHGCLDELCALLVELGWRLVHDESGTPVSAAHPAGRTAVFLGDLVDRGPDTPGVLRLAMGMVADRVALAIAGNHEVKLVRALRGRDVRRSHGLAESLAQLERQPDEFVAAATGFMDGLIGHYVLDGGRLVVAHAGLREQFHGRASKRVRAFALYGETSGETDEFGLPVRYPWATGYRGAATVVYGHTPVPEAEWVNNTICLDTGCVRRCAHRAALPGTGAGGGAGRESVVRADPAVARGADAGHRRRPRTRRAGRHRRARQAHGDHRPAGTGHGAGGELGRRAGGVEPVRHAPPVAGVPAADHGAGRDLGRSGPAGAPRGGVRGLRPRRRGPGGHAGQAHGFAGGDRGLPGRGGGGPGLRCGRRGARRGDLPYRPGAAGTAARR